MKWFPFGKSKPPVPEIPEAWDFYPCRVDDHRASILVDLGYADFAPLASHPQLLWIVLEILEPDDHGLGSRADAEKLHAIEDRIVATAIDHGMRYVGRLRNRGDWQMTFYGTGDHEALLEGFLRAGLGDEARRGHVGTKPDADWSYYREFLYPSEERLQWMKDRDVVHQLMQHGDVASLPRVVDHCVIFPPGVEPAEFLRATEALGFSNHEVGDPEGPDRVFEARREDPVEIDHIHEIVIKLTEMVEAVGGTYDGWGCSVTKDED